MRLDEFLMQICKRDLSVYLIWINVIQSVLSVDCVWIGSVLRTQVLLLGHWTNCLLTLIRCPSSRDDSSIRRTAVVRKFSCSAGDLSWQKAFIWDVTFLGNVFPETTLQRRPVESFTFYGRVFLGVQFSSCREGVRKDWFFSQLWTASHSDLSDEDYAVWVYTGGSSPLLPAMHAILGLRKLLGTFSDVKTLAGVFSGLDWWLESILEFSHCPFFLREKTIPIRLSNVLIEFSKFMKILPQEGTK